MSLLYEREPITVKKKSTGNHECFIRQKGKIKNKQARKDEKEREKNNM